MYKYDVERQVETLGEMFPRVADFLIFVHPL